MPKRIGDFLIERGLITPEMIPEILRHGETTGKRFGDAAVDLGLVSESKMVEVFGPGHEFDFFHLEPAYFPQVTKEILPRGLMFRLGALPLGIKTEHKLFRAKRVLNLGMLNPKQGGAVDEILAKVRAEESAPHGENALNVDGAHVFLVLADQYLDVVRDVYGINREELRKIDPTQLDETLAMFLDTTAR